METTKQMCYMEKQFSIYFNVTSFSKSSKSTVYLTIPFATPKKKREQELYIMLHIGFVLKIIYKVFFHISIIQHSDGKIEDPLIEIPWSYFKCFTNGFTES